jgi:hypothetical protein
MKNINPWVIIALIVGFAGGAGAAWAQLLPPPPAVLGASADGFTEKDRKRLNQVYVMTLAIHTKLFPLRMEQQLQDGGGVDLIH